ncbi:AHH domain-containing protein [Cronobacter dublinensis]
MAPSGTNLPAHSKIHTKTYKQNVYERLNNIDNAEDFFRSWKVLVT